MSSLPIRFVLVETSHPGNIGAVARAMKNMGVLDLVLVKPREYPHPDATARAAGSDDVLANARVVETLAEAIADCGLVFATTARTRDQYFRVLEAREAATRMVAEARTGSGAVAVLFGTERFGLSNEQLHCAHALLRIPANPEYVSLNIAMAAQLIAYEILMAQHLPGEYVAPRETPLATPVQMEGFYSHLQQVMDEVGFRDRTQVGTNLMGRIRRLFTRAELDSNELNILRGILTAVQGRRRKASDDH
ncbi:MAG: RNA methyltransferase [Pseudomonadota bacterium]